MKTKLLKQIVNHYLMKETSNTDDLRIQQINNKIEQLQNHKDQLQSQIDNYKNTIEHLKDRKERINDAIAKLRYEKQKINLRDRGII